MLDWDDLRFFLAVARQGSLSKAARSLAVTQPTVGRRLAACEAKLGAQLFERSAAGLALSDVGRALLPSAERMEAHALHAESLASGRSVGISGTVRLTAAEWTARSLIGPALGPLLERHPRLTIELVADARHLSLAKREADIALRASPFTHPEIVQRALAPLAFALYASDGYLARRGAPDFTTGCEGHTFIEMTDGLAHLADYEWLPRVRQRAHVGVRTNGREPMATMALAGVGIACLPRFLGDALPGLRRLTAPAPSPPRKLWLGVHRAARATPRVRAVVAYLAEALRGLSHALDPDGEG
ncbi:MAG: LysR family transcriptional regulator [Polyangiales bacterium]